LPDVLGDEALDVLVARAVRRHPDGLRRHQGDEALEEIRRMRLPAAVPSQPGIEVLRSGAAAHAGNVPGHEQGKAFRLIVAA